MPGTDALITLGVLFALLVALALELFSVDMLMMMALVALVAVGVVELDTALEGFANATLVALGSLYIVAAGLREAGALEAAAKRLLGEEKNQRTALARLCPSVTISSAFLNNTPIVAMGIPAVSGWAKRHGFSPSQFLMPLSFAAILGGLWTLIGTSTNLVTHGLLLSHGMEGLGFFELAWVGVPCAIAGWFYLVLIAPSLIPEREELRAAEEKERGRRKEVEVERGSPLAGRTVEEAEVGKVSGHALARLRRGDRSYAPVEAEEELAEGDVLTYEPTAVEEAAGEERPGRSLELDLRAVPGLKPARRRKIRDDEEDRELHEAVVKEGSPLIGRPLEALEIPERFNAVVQAVRRGGQRLQKPLGDIRLRPGDVLLMETGRGFREAFEDVPAFFITSQVGGSRSEEEVPATEEKPPRILLAVSILVGVVLATALGWLHIALSATIGAFTMVALGFLTPGEAREAVDWSILVVIGAALGLGRAMEVSGAAGWIGTGIVDLFAGYGSIGLLAGVFIATTLLTNVITNNGAAAIVFPIALSIAASQGLDPRPLIITLTVGASTSMITPIGYQTNLMVYGPGNYRFFDFARVGTPLQLVIMAVALVVIPLVWTF